MRATLLLLLLMGCSSVERAPRFILSGDVADIRQISPTQYRIRATGEITVEVPGKRTMALFPGLEFLEGGQRSSADRRRPEPWKVTVPLMAFEVEGHLVTLMWKEGAAPLFEAGDQNRMGLAPAGGEIEAVLHVERGATIYDAVPRWTETFGLPAPEPWPRTMEEELALCKAGFASVSAGRGKHRHAVGNSHPADWTPGFGVLLHLLGEPVDWFDYSDLLSTVNTHILRWEAPFYAGEPGTVRKLVERMAMLAEMREGADGEWGYHPTTAQERKLGTPGESLLGTSAHHAYSVAKAARMTGNAELKAIALDVLARLRRHKVPRGGLGTQVPIDQPDLAAAAYAVAAYVEAFKLSGDRAWLADAARWAKAGLPFVYLWNLPGRKEMRYASVAVYGPTMLGVPVQWSGLVYAYFLRKLAPHDRSVDWLRVADGITASAVHQQYTEGPSKGCYPDALHERLSRRSPPDLNPEDILANILSSLGKDPDPDLSVNISATQKR